MSLLARLSLLLTNEGKSPPLLYAAAVVLWLACGALYLTVPPSPDQFEFDYVGWRMLEGEAPYRDFIDMNFPGGYWLHALSTALFGQHVWSWRALDFIIATATAWPLARLVGDAGGPAARRSLWILYPLLYCSLPQWIAGQTDTTAGQFLIACLACHALAYSTRRKALQIATGALLTLAMLNKPTLGILGALLPIPALLSGHRTVEVVKHTALAAAASVVTLVVAFAAVLLHGTSARDVYESVYVYNTATQFLDATPLPRMLSTFATVHFVWWHFVSVAGLAAGAFVIARSRTSLPGMSLVMLWVSCVASFFIQGRWFQYHLSVCFLALLGLMCVGIGSLARMHWSKAPPPVVALVALAVALIGSVKKLEGNYGKLPGALLRNDFKAHYTQFSEGGSLDTAQALQLIDYVREHVAPNETLYVFGSASSINFLAPRVQPTRFFYAPVIKNAVPPLPMADAWLRLFEADLHRGMPKLCVIERVDMPWLNGASAPAGILKRFLDTYYTPATSPHPEAPYLLFARR